MAQAPPAPVQLSTILGSQGAPGPQAPPDVWKQHGDHVSYDKGVVVGTPGFDNMGPGTINAEMLYIEGVPISGVTFVEVSGDTMEGPLILYDDPTAPLEAATKQYVDATSLEVGTEFYGVFTAQTGMITWNASSGMSGNMLPPVPDEKHVGKFLICSVAGDVAPTGAPAPPSYGFMAGDWLMCDGTEWKHLTTASGGYVRKIGDTISGPLHMNGGTAFISLNADPVEDMHPVSLRFLRDELGALVAGVEIYGVFDASNGTIRWNTNSGMSGNELPPPNNPDLEGRYLICSREGNVPPTNAPLDDYLAGDWLICNGVDAWFHIYSDHGYPKADQVEVNPIVAGGSTVQAALEALDRKNAADAVPPVDPAPGTLWFDPISLQLYVWYYDGTSSQWVVAINQAPYVPPMDFLPLAGGTLTGPVTGPAATFDDIAAAHSIVTPWLGLNCTTQYAASFAAFNGGGAYPRWNITMVVPQSEAGGESGSNFTIDAYTDAGGWLRTAFALRRSDGYATFTGAGVHVDHSLNVGQGSGNAVLTLDGGNYGTDYIQATKGNVLRWQLILGDGVGETGSNAGSNFYLHAFGDGGDYIATPIQVARNTGRVYMPKAGVGVWPQAGDDIAHKSYVDNRMAAAEAAAVGVVPVGGVILYAGPNIPANFLLCNGAHYLPSDAPKLFDAIGGYYYWDGTAFGVPYLIDRTAVGAGYSWGLAAAGGEIWHTLSVGEMPHHAHSLYDPTHVHGVGDPGHGHGFADPGHGHSGAQDSHQHGASQDSHVHWYEALMNSGFGSPAGSNWAWGGRNTNGPNAAGVYVDWRQPTVYVYGAGTGCWNYSSGVGVWLDYRYTGQSVYGEGGSGAHNNMQPFTAMYYIIRYQ